MAKGSVGSKAWNEAEKRRAQGRPPRFMVEESAFDKMVREAGIHPDRAPEFKMVQDWVRRNYTLHYVPEKVLEALKISPESVLYVPRG
jgi:hypothetical protein